jgi:hypothetical protein
MLRLKPVLFSSCLLAVSKSFLVINYLFLVLIVVPSSIFLKGCQHGYLYGKYFGFRAYA